MEYLDRSEGREDESSESESEEDMDDRCEQILDKVVQEHLSRLKDYAGIEVIQFNTVERPHYS